MNLVEVPIKSSAELRDGMVLIYNSLPEKRWLIRGNHRHSYTVEHQGQKIPVSNHRKNKIMISDFDNPKRESFLGCFDITPEHYKVYRPKTHQPEIPNEIE